MRRSPMSSAAGAIAEVAAATAVEHGLQADLLDAYLSALLEAARTGRRLAAAEQADCRRLGADAAGRGVGLPALVDLYMSASRRLWPRLPALVAGGRDRPVQPAELVTLGEVVWLAADTALAAVTAGYVDAQREVVRREEAFRREFVDDLLLGRSDVGSLVERAERFGLSLTAAHVVAVAATDRPVDSGMQLTGGVADSLRARLGDRGLLVAAKDGRLVCVLSTGGPQEAQRDAEADGQVLAEVVGPAAARLVRRGTWRVGVGRPHPGPRGVLRSYREAVDALEVAGRLDLPQPIVHARDLLVYRVLLRDEAAIADLVNTVLGPLTGTRGGPYPLMRTLEAYFAAGSNGAEAARRLHLSVRAVSYRLQRVRDLTGYAAGDPADHLPLLVAVTGARLLDWPDRPLVVE